MINAHGGGVLYHEGKYYWFGEHRPESGFVTEKGSIVIHLLIC